MKRVNISSGSAFEKPIGFSRAVRIGNFISVAGTAPIAQDGTTAFSGDLYFFRDPARLQFYWNQESY